jgi:hypothetical protein
MAKAIIPLEAVARQWKTTSTGTSVIPEKVERRFLRTLRNSTR